MLADIDRRRGHFHAHRRSIRDLALVALAAASLAAPATAAAVPGGATVFVHSAASGKLAGGKLVLAGVSGRVSWATNSGRAGVISVRRFHRHMLRPGKPATGTLHIAGQRGGQELAFRLRRPRYNAARKTVAYRAKPLAKRRAAAASGLRRFGAASLSIVPHPTLMGTSESGGATCGVTLTNNTGHDLTLQSPGFKKRRTDSWNPPPPGAIAAGATASWASESKVGDGCLNDGAYLIGGSTREFVVITVGAGPDGQIENPICTPSEPAFICSGASLSGGTIAWTVQPR
jgi:hypothetical protein